MENLHSTSHIEAPRATININGQPIAVLLDTGAEISCVHPNIVNSLAAQVDTSKIIAYTGVNSVKNATFACVYLPIFNQDIKFHVNAIIKRSLIEAGKAFKH